MKTVEIEQGSRIEYFSPELLFLGSSGQPYRGKVYIRFISSGKTFNLLDFKKFITSLRHKTILSENIAKYIYDEIKDHVGDNLGVIVDLTARGGIQQTIEYGKEFEPRRQRNLFFQM